MLSSDLFYPVLLEPTHLGADRLYIVSGYSTSAMASHHLEQLRNIGANVRVHLIVGMTPQDGITHTNHKGFQQLSSSPEMGFICSYVTRRPAVHSKVYVWARGTEPVIAFLGSPNYTQTAFYNQREVVTDTDPSQAFEYFESLVPDTIYCTHSDVESTIQFRRRISVDPEADVSGRVDVEPNVAELESIEVSLLARGGKMHTRGGLNWGQREGRERNQAYIPITAEVSRSGFFPPVGKHFTVLTDDNKVLICTRAQQNGKAIQTPNNNSHLGEYFRNRLGLSSGAFVEKADLLRYGRTSVTFYKLDEETYYMDFSI